MDITPVTINTLVTRPPEVRGQGTGYITVNGDKAIAMKEYGKTIEQFDTVQKTIASDGAISHRSPYSAADFFRGRPMDILPSRFRDVVFLCRMAYIQTGIVRNVIDMMTDFACEGLKFVHPDKKNEAFFRVWAKRVKIKDAVNEFVRHLLIDGNVVLMRTKAKITEPVKREWEGKSIGFEEPDKGDRVINDNETHQEDDPPLEKIYVSQKTKRNEIPWNYHFLNVAALYWVGGEANIANNSRGLAFKPAETLIQAIKTPRDIFQQQLVNNLPEKVRRAVQDTGNQGNIIFLDMEDLIIMHNKKDSWEDWSPPFLYSVLTDLQYKNKLRQAEMSALDGVINVIRLWKLGDHKLDYMPTPDIIDRLTHALDHNTGGGAMDLVWDSLIDMKDYYPPIGEILGQDKYMQVNQDILIGLGVPEVLLGGHGSKFSNSYVQLKTLIERLNYLREKVTEWLDGEMKILCEAMNIDVLPLVKFAQGNLEDQNVAKKLIVGLLDRNIISVEAVLDAYGEDFLVEIERMKKEKPLLKEAKVDVIGPFDPNVPAPKAGSAPAKPGVTPKKKPQPKGRQPGGINTGQKTRVAQPKTGPNKTRAELTMLALDAIDLIDEYIVPEFMESQGIESGRKMTSEQKELTNNARVLVLASFLPDDTLTEQNIFDIAERSEKADACIVNLVNQNMSEFISNKGSNPTLNQRKRIEALSWSQYFTFESNQETEE